MEIARLVEVAVGVARQRVDALQDVDDREAKTSQFEV